MLIVNSVVALQVYQCRPILALAECQGEHFTALILSKALLRTYLPSTPLFQTFKNHSTLLIIFKDFIIFKVLNDFVKSIGELFKQNPFC